MVFVLSVIDMPCCDAVCLLSLDDCPAMVVLLVVDDSPLLLMRVLRVVVFLGTASPLGVMVYSVIVSSMVTVLVVSTSVTTVLFFDVSVSALCSDDTCLEVSVSECSVLALLRVNAFFVTEHPANSDAMSMMMIIFISSWV